MAVAGIWPPLRKPRGKPKPIRKYRIAFLRFFGFDDGYLREIEGIGPPRRYHWEIGHVSASLFLLLTGALYFVEMNPRYGTGISLSIAAGIEFPRLQWLAHYDPDAITPDMLKFRANVEMLRYWEEVYRFGDEAFGHDVPT